MIGTKAWTGRGTERGALRAGQPGRTAAMARLRPVRHAEHSPAAERLRDRPFGRNEYVHQEVAAVRRRCHIFDEQIAQGIIHVSICEREVQGSLYLSAELPCLPLSLPT